MSKQAPRVLLIATNDTKQAEAAFLRQCLEAEGVEVIHLDASIRRLVGTPEYGPAAVAAAAGSTIEDVRALRHEGKCQEVMMEGARILAHEIDDQHRLSGILGLGGSMGTTLATLAMRSFPYGLPKVMITTMASGFTAPFVGTSDIIMMNAVCDVAGINSITRDIYRNGALATAGMARHYRGVPNSDAPVVLMGTLGTTEMCSHAIRTALEERGFEVLVFHTLGGGGQTLDQIARERDVAVVIELSLVEIMDHLHGGLCSAGPDRGRSALRKGIPTIFVPGNCDFMVSGPITDAQKRFPGKRYHIHNAALTAVRTESPELENFARHLADMLTDAAGEVSVYVPLQGFSNHDSTDGHLHDPSMPPILVEAFQRNLSGRVPLNVVDAHINSHEFAEVIIAQVIAYAGAPVLP